MSADEGILGNFENLSFNDIKDLSLEDDDLLSGEEDIINQLVSVLTEHGFENLDELTYDQLLFLKSRLEVINDESSMINLIYTCIDELHNTADTLATSKATLSAVDFDKDSNFIDKLRNGQIPRGLSDRNLNIIFTIISRLYADMLTDPSNKDILTVDNIYDYLSANTDIDLAEIEDNQEVIFNYLESIVNQIVTSHKQTTKRIDSESSSRKILADYLLQEELSLRKQIVNDYLVNENLKIHYIKQIYRNDSGFYFKCEECGEVVKIDKIIATYIAFPTEKTKFTKMFLKIFKCSCGYGYVFTSKDYELLSKYIESGLSSSITSFVDKLSGFCKGSSTLRIKIPSSIISNVFESLIISDNVETTEKESEHTNNAVNMELNIGDDEFKLAVKQFYSRLNGMRNNRTFSKNVIKENEKAISFNQLQNAKDTTVLRVANTSYTYQNRSQNNKLSYSEMAYYVCNMLSKDYIAVKNSAIFSLLFSLDENSNISEYINCSKLWDLKAVLKLLDNNTDIRPDLISVDIMSELIAINSFYSDDINEFDKDKDINDYNYRQHIFDSLKTKKGKLLETIKELEEKRKVIIDELIECKEALAFTNIYNMSQYKLIDFDCIVNDDIMFSLVDEVSDRMIINYYSEEFYNVWISMNIVNKSNLQKILTNYTDNESVQKSLNKLVTKLFNEHNINIPSDIFDKYFYMTYQLSQNKLSLLKDLSNAFQSGNYYRFCKVLAKIPNDVDTLVSADFTNKFKLFIIENRSKAKEFLQKYPTEQEYFLSQFNKDEINIIDFESSPIKFSRYLPKRLPDESIINYIERYKQLKKDSLLSKYNSIDYGEQFRDMTKWYPTIYSCSLLYNTEYHSFASGTFMCQLLNLIVNFGDRVSKLPILGITESILNILDNSLYVLDKDNFNLDILEAQYITLFGTYFTSISNKIENLNNRYAYQFLSTSKSLNEKLKYFNFRDELEALVMSDETSFVIEDGGDNDYEAAMDELRIFTNGYDEFAEILR